MAGMRHATRASELLVVVLALVLQGSDAGGRSLRASAPQPQVLANYKATGKSLALVPGFPQPESSPNPTLMTWYTPGFPVWAGNAFADATTVTVDSTGTIFTTSPITRTVPPGVAGTLDHVKHLAFSRNDFTAAPKTNLVYRVSMSAAVTSASKNPFPAVYKSKVTKPSDDLRLGACCANIIDINTFIVMDMFLTNDGVWAFYERLPFGRSATNMYHAFSYAKRIASRKPFQLANIEMGYDREAGALWWSVDGKVGLRVDKIGFPPTDPLAVPMLDMGGVSEVVNMTGFGAGFGCFTLLDAADPHKPSDRATGLLRLVPDNYVTPTAWVKDGINDADAAADPALRLWGLSTRLRVARYSVLRVPKP